VKQFGTVSEDLGGKHAEAVMMNSLLRGILQRFDQNCGVCLNTFFGIIP
jgi:hypothetical protein